MVQQPLNIANSNLDSRREINVNKLHQILSHASEAMVYKTAKSLGLKLTAGKFEKCEKCAKGKAKQANLNKDQVERYEEKGHCLFTDISSIKSESYSRAKFWLLVIDDATDMCWSFLLRKKSESTNKIRELIKELNARVEIKVRYIRWDNAGKNKQLENDCKADGLGLQFEYTAPNTPQQNGRVKRTFATLYGRVRSMLNNA